MNDLSIIIVNYNTINELSECIKSIRTHTSDVKYEIVVVDNNSKDGSREMLESDLSDIKKIFLSFNSGFSYANNVAMKQVKSKYALLLNPDTYLIENSFKIMLEFLTQNPEIGAVGPIITNAEGKFSLTMSKFPSLFLLLLETLSFKNALRKYSLSKIQRKALSNKTEFEVDWISGGCLMVRTETYNHIGRLDERYHLFSEDVDLCLRLKQTNWKIFCLPQTRVIHIGGVSTSRNHFTLVSNRYKSRLIYCKKHFKGGKRLTYHMITIIGLISRIIGTILLIKMKRKEKIARLRAYLKATRLWMGISSDAPNNQT